MLEFDKQRVKLLPAATIRYVLQNEHIDMLTIGLCLEVEIDADIKTLLGDTTYTPNDRALLADFNAKAFESDAIKRMKIE